MSLTRYGSILATIIKAIIESATSEPTLESGEVEIWKDTSTTPNKTYWLMHDGSAQVKIGATNPTIPIVNAASEPTLTSGEICIFNNTSTSRSYLLWHNGTSQVSVEGT